MTSMPRNLKMFRQLADTQTDMQGLAADFNNLIQGFAGQRIGILWHPFPWVRLRASRPQVKRRRLMPQDVTACSFRTVELNGEWVGIVECRGGQDSKGYAPPSEYFSTDSPRGHRLTPVSTGIERCQLLRQRKPRFTNGLHQHVGILCRNLDWLAHLQCINTDIHLPRSVNRNL